MCDHISLKIISNNLLSDVLSYSNSQIAILSSAFAGIEEVFQSFRKRQLS
jgi:hypothetical protein